MLGLASATDAAWAERAVDALDRVLVDHAHCEMKAASSALALAARAVFAPELVRPLVALAQEELAHFDRLLVELERRGLTLGPPPVDDYATELLRAARGAEGGRERLVDRLLAGALIEARSCERFKLLADALDARGMVAERDLYRELLASEAQHHTLLRSLAAGVSGDETATEARFQVLARVEADINARHGAAPAIHG